VVSQGQLPRKSKQNDAKENPSISSIPGAALQALSMLAAWSVQSIKVVAFRDVALDKATFLEEPSDTRRESLSRFRP
jgi:hypothetical protein